MTSKRRRWQIRSPHLPADGAAEELIFHSIATGASNDIEQATKIARGMISQFGMSEDFDMVAMQNVSNQYLGGEETQPLPAPLRPRH